MKTAKRLGVGLVLAGLAAWAWAVQSPEVELGAGGNYDGTVKIQRDDSGRMVFKDHDNSDGVTLEALRTREIDLVPYIRHLDLDTEAELESHLMDVTNVYTNNDGKLSDDDLSDNTTDDLPEGTGHLYYTQSRVDATNVESLHTAGASGLAPISNGAGALTMTDIATQAELAGANVESFHTAGASGLAPVSNGAGALAMTDIATQAELNAKNYDSTYVNVTGDEMSGALSLDDTLTVQGLSTFYGYVNIAGLVTMLGQLDCNNGIYTKFVHCSEYVKGANLMLGPAGSPNALTSYDTNGDIFFTPNGTGVVNVTKQLNVTPTSGTSFTVGSTQLRVVDGQVLAGSGTYAGISGAPQLLALHASDARLGAAAGANKATLLRYNTIDDCGSVFAYDYGTSTPKTLRLNEAGGGVVVGGASLASGSALTAAGGIAGVGTSWRYIACSPYAGEFGISTNAIDVPVPYEAGTIITRLSVKYRTLEGETVTLSLQRNDATDETAETVEVEHNAYTMDDSEHPLNEVADIADHTMLAGNAYWVRLSFSDAGDSSIPILGIETSRRMY